MNSTGEWLAFGSSKLGQLLVWEWQSESYVLKQQGHHNDMSCIDYSLDGQYLATGGDDGKVKIWSAQTGFCFVTFSDHTAPVKSVEFARKKHIVFSASLDGTVRAYDLIRYRNFKTFTTPAPEQFSTLAIDPSAEIVCAASQDNFEIYMWSVQTGKLLEIVAGHEAPVSAMVFSPTSGQLASSSWDKTVRTWDLFARDKSVEVMEHTSEVLALAFAPNGEILATSTLDGIINFWNMDSYKLIGSIEGRKDIVGGRSSRDKVSLEKSGAGKYFTSLCFTSDGKSILAGGNSKYVCLYDIDSSSLLKRFQTTSNLSLDRMQEILNSKNMTEAGPRDLIDMDGELSDLEDRIDRTLPGVQSGDRSVLSKKPEARTFAVKMSPTSRAWAAATTQGLLIFSTDETIHFDPFGLDMDVTPESIMKYLKQEQFTKALIASFRLGEQEYTDKVYNTIPAVEVPLVLQDLGSSYFDRFLKLLNRQLEHSPRLEFHMHWLVTFLKKNTHYMTSNAGEFKPILRSLHKWISNVNDDVLSM
jgi:periodic tryptophan protein 2